VPPAVVSLAMPLVAWGALAYGVGLLAAFTLSGVASTALAAMMLVTATACGARRGGTSAAIALLFVAGELAAFASAQHDAECAARLSRAHEWRGGFESAVRSGDVARATLHAGGCHARATLLVVTGAARSGDEARIRGDATADARGLLVRNVSLDAVTHRSSLAAVRARVGARIDRLFGPDAPVARALVIADMSAIPAEQRDRFARAGLVHMLSVSGLHVAIIALALELLASILRLPSRPAHLVTLGVIAAYVAGIGAPPPAVRAAVMLGLVLGSRLLQRPTSPWAVLAVGGAAPLVDARTVLDLGWQLSVAGTVALVAGGTLAGRIVPKRWRGMRRSIARASLVSVVATIVTAPLVAWSFGRIALLGPVTNLLADPIMGVLQPLLFLALCSPLPWLSTLAADAAHGLLIAFDVIATHAAQVPGAAPAVLPTVLAACAGGLAAVAVIAACVAERPARYCLVALCSLAALICEPLATPTRRETELHMLDVGQGDALAIRTRQGRWIVVDAGRSWPNGDAGRSVVVPYIAHRGGAVAVFVLSHPHADHVGGAASLFSALRPARFLDPGYVGTTPPYLAALAAARAEGIPWQRVRPGDSLMVDEVVLTELAPDSAWASHLADANLASTVLLVRVGNVRMLLTGDAEWPEEEWLLAHARAALAADVLKVAHHGSATSTMPPFLAAVHPRLALVSVGAHNSYGHPDPEVMNALHASGAQLLRTDLAGTVVVYTDGGRLEVEARGQRWEVQAHAPVP
jgi:competence protein ComEC